jgi:hypothetical protein
MSPLRPEMPPIENEEDKDKEIKPADPDKISEDKKRFFENVYKNPPGQGKVVQGESEGEIKPANIEDMSEEERDIFENLYKHYKAEEENPEEKKE